MLSVYKVQEVPAVVQTHVKDMTTLSMVTRHTVLDTAGGPAKDSAAALPTALQKQTLILSAGREELQIYFKNWFRRKHAKSLLLISTKNMGFLFFHPPPTCPSLQKDYVPGHRKVLMLKP